MRCKNQNPQRSGREDKNMGVELNDPDVIWHYTKMETIQRIFLPVGEKREEGTITLRYTNIRFLNDPTETKILKPGLINHKDKLNNMGKIGKILLKDIEELDTQGKNFHDISNKVYSFSATSIKDSFAFWDTEYAGRKGISVGFKKNMIKEEISNDFAFGGPKPILYINSNKIDDKDFETIVAKAASKYNEYNRMKKFLEEELHSEADKFEWSFLEYFLGTSSCTCKHISWEHEREWRSLLFIKNDIETTVFSKNDVKKIYLASIDQKCVDSIILGPECNEDQREAIEDYLKNNGYYDIKVEISHAFDSINSI